MFDLEANSLYRREFLFREVKDEATGDVEQKLSKRRIP